MVEHDFARYDLSDNQVATLTEYSKRIFESVDELLASIPTTDVRIEDVATDVNELASEYIPSVGMHQYNREYMTILGSCIIVHLRELDVPVRMDEIASIIREETDYTDIDKNDMGKWKRKIDAFRGSLTTPANTEIFIDRYVTEMNLSGGDTEGVALDIIDQIEDRSGKSPSVLAGRILWVASQQSDEHVLQQDIAEISGATTMSIRSDVDEIETYIQPTA